VAGLGLGQIRRARQVRAVPEVEEQVQTELIMQVFVPYDDPDECAFVLDGKRLWKQRVETMQIMNALADPDYFCANHPAVTAWRGFSCALWVYQQATITEGKRRGYTDNVCFSKTLAFHMPTCNRDCTFQRSDQAWPNWWGDPAIHESHRSRLLDKDFDHYIGAGPLFDETPLGLPYLWPTNTPDGFTVRTIEAKS
jgi:hypothetical protein